MLEFVWLQRLGYFYCSWFNKIRILPYSVKQGYVISTSPVFCWVLKYENVSYSMPLEEIFMVLFSFDSVRWSCIVKNLFLLVWAAPQRSCGPLVQEFDFPRQQIPSPAPFLFSLYSSCMCQMLQKTDLLYWISRPQFPDHGRMKTKFCIFRHLYFRR